MYVLTYLHSLALRLHNDKLGAVATEYAFLVAFFAIAGAASILILGENMSSFLLELTAGLEKGAEEAPKVASAS